MSRENIVHGTPPDVDFWYQNPHPFITFIPSGEPACLVDHWSTAGGHSDWFIRDSICQWRPKIWVVKTRPNTCCLALSTPAMRRTLIIYHKSHLAVTKTNRRQKMTAMHGVHPMNLTMMTDEWSKSYLTRSIRLSGTQLHFFALACNISDFSPSSLHIFYSSKEIFSTSKGECPIRLL
jgi:hypothetical protein